MSLGQGRAARPRDPSSWGPGRRSTSALSRRLGLPATVDAPTPNAHEATRGWNGSISAATLRRLGRVGRGETGLLVGKSLTDLIRGETGHATAAATATELPHSDVAIWRHQFEQR